jgi:hypothetical protein
MDLIVGASAETIAEWSGGRVEPHVVYGICFQLLDIVAAAHGSGVVHRDIKPDNICLTRDGTVKLLDFGVARMRDALTATRNGTTIGTPAFMAPEQALGRVSEIDNLSDLYAVGAVMYTLLSGRFVHHGESSNELLIMAATRRAPSLSDVVSDIPKSIVDVVDRALLFEKSRRWPSVEAMQRALGLAHMAEYGVPPIAGTQLARVLDGIQPVDYTSAWDEDDWPTLLLDRATLEAGQRQLGFGKRGDARDAPVARLHGDRPASRWMPQEVHSGAGRASVAHGFARHEDTGVVLSRVWTKYWHVWLGVACALVLVAIGIALVQRSSANRMQPSLAGVSKPLDHVGSAAIAAPPATEQSASPGKGRVDVYSLPSVPDTAPGTTNDGSQAPSSSGPARARDR